MIYTTEVQHMCPVAKGAYHGPAPIPEEGKWVQAKQLSDISGFTHGIGWGAPQQGVLMASHTRSVLSASRMVLPMRISDAIAAEWVMPEQPMVSTSAS